MRRVVLIDPVARTITEEQLASPSGSGCPLSRMMHLPAGARIQTPVTNGHTGDALHVASPGEGPTWLFLGERYRGRGVILGRGIRDAVVPLARVKTQVRWQRAARGEPVATVRVPS